MSFRSAISQPDDDCHILASGLAGHCSRFEFSKFAAQICRCRGVPRFLPFSYFLGNSRPLQPQVPQRCWVDPFVAFWAIRLGDAEVDHAPWIRTVDTRRRVQCVVQDEDRVAWFTLHQCRSRPAVSLRVCNISARVTCQFQAKVGIQRRKHNV